MIYVILHQLINGFNSCIFIDENMFICLAPECNTGSGDSGGSIITLWHYMFFNPAPNATLTQKCNIMRTTSALKNLKIMCDSIWSVQIYKKRW